jgi:dimeric dUTPase (all-alpha-NTP-PPase superfamily)
VRVDLKNYAQSRISPFDEFALRLLLDKVSSNKEDITVLEIGSWLGAGSTQIISEYANKIVCVDHWQGSDNQEQSDIIEKVDPYLIFQENISLFKSKVISIRCNSNQIDPIIKEEAFDFIFIDGDHRYAQTKVDIATCLGKLKRNGIICGHSCEGRVNDVNAGYLKNHLDENHIDSIFKNFKHCHPGVIMAVDEVLENYELFSDAKYRMDIEVAGRHQYGNSSIWFKVFG